MQTFIANAGLISGLLNFIAPICDLIGFVVLYNSSFKKKEQLKKDIKTKIHIPFTGAENEKRRIRIITQDQVGYFFVVTGGLCWAIAALIEI